MEGLELISFKIISAVGTAKSMYIEAIELAKEGKIQEAKEMILNGEQTFVEGHRAHAELVQKEASGEKSEFSILLMHAEDQLMSAESFGILSKQFVDLYERLLNIQGSKTIDAV
jgi:cellobiose PTS system EIIA component